MSKHPCHAGPDTVACDAHKARSLVVEAQLVAIWIETNNRGDYFVMVAHPDHFEPMPFEAATFKCDPLYTDPETNFAMARRYARAIGGVRPILFVRPDPDPSMTTTTYPSRSPARSLAQLPTRSPTIDHESPRNECDVY